MRKILVLLSVLYGGFCGVAIACDVNEIDVLGDGTNCESAKFTITTTELEPNTTFAFYMSASGTFYVDWGDGVVDIITRNDTTETLYDHTYTTAGIKTIRFGGLATGYNDDDSPAAAIRFGYGADEDEITPELIVSIDGSIGQIFQTLGQTNSTQPAFIWTFARTNITNIPADVFSGVSGYRRRMFYATFYRCINLTTIPKDLFSDIFGGATSMFRSTFNRCTAITAIPPELFSNINISANELFYYTFRDCSSLSGFIPANLFSGLAGTTYKTSMMSNTFQNTRLDTTCPTGTSQVITGYEERWGGKVACTPHTHVCDSGTYFPTTTDGCALCPENYYCSGGTYTYNGSDQGLTACAPGLYAPVGMWEVAQCGRILHVGDEVVYLRSTKKTSPALHIDIDNDGGADFFGNMTTADIPMTRGTVRKLKLQYGGVTYSVYDDSVDFGE